MLDKERYNHAMDLIIQDEHILCSYIVSLIHNHLEEDNQAKYEHLCLLEEYLETKQIYNYLDTVKKIKENYELLMKEGII